MQQTIDETQTLSISSNNECNTFKHSSSHNSSPHKYSVSSFLVDFQMTRKIYHFFFCFGYFSFELQEFWQRSPVYKERTQKQFRESSYKILPITGKKYDKKNYMNSV